ncbi:hypothetical protein FNW02_29270 [Komarekiella sp. 'clone 1']|uniref:Uncharacterized protein n=1 Tax=Komarekiella delphini-convector SJRDD-AB1 TaxID=2593771 RepID=A0AA40T329_9NOST|nr:hypothetical protein [Komarekiella delphini-convector]MBD6619790.1 hypothetical protein [Komarekiella delphini-convector SJRDD-AB1]
MKQEIWIFYQNEPGMPGCVIGTFSTPEKAMTCKAIRGKIGFNQWDKKEEYWICKPLDKEYYFSVEPSTIDALVDG